ncbi:MAG: hypothetical protein ACJ76S_08920 [Solirubrobacteraceae bacterium]
MTAHVPRPDAAHDTPAAEGRAGLPPSATEFENRGGDAERRLEERREAEEELRRRRAYHIEAAFWALMGALVVLYLFFAGLGAVDPAEAPGATLVIAVVALIWLAHAWERLYAGGHVSRSDRERRGF